MTTQPKPDITDITPDLKRIINECLALPDFTSEVDKWRLNIFKHRLEGKTPLTDRQLELLMAIHENTIKNWVGA